MGVMKHGEAKRSGLSPEYITWASMMQRCYNKNCKAYAHYGAKGITVCGRWHLFVLFLQDMGRKPSPSHQIDRIDNNQGYFRDNCRWATKSEQMHNRGNWNKHGYKYVRKWGNKFAANIRVNGRTVYLGLFATPVEASAAGAAAKRSMCHL